MAWDHEAVLHGLQTAVQPDGPAGATIHMRHVRLREPSDRTEGAVTAELRVTQPEGGTETWALHLPLDTRDASLPEQALVATVQANVMEWWHLKDQDPQTARLARRIS
ncbi:hypothetical protein [Streptomyces sp. NPDC008150]|uniref:hypothetical protein n=1 Tax=Streptomyces sp. NPDC008150 TaxID=3364816 RepID=UPI0036EEC959